MEKVLTDMCSFIKEQIETLRTITISTQKMYQSEYFSEKVFQDTESNVIKVAYNLLSSIYNLGGDSEQEIYDEFTKYMYGEKYDNLDTFIKWLNQI